MTDHYFRFRILKDQTDKAARDGTFCVKGDGTYYFQLDEEFLRSDPPRGGPFQETPTPDAVRRKLEEVLPKWLVDDVVQPRLGPGQYHPRVWRQAVNPAALAIYGQEFTSDMVAFELLELDMERLFQIIEPVHGSPNMAAYGHEIRRLLILACTEVENLLKSLMKANGYNPSGLWSTRDYVKVLSLVPLDAIESKLGRYPDFPPIRPFQGWNASQPTQSLDWYDAYNLTKHERSAGMKEATFGRALRAVAAVHVLLTAQFGIGLLQPNWGQFTLKTVEHSSRLFENHNLLASKPVDQYIPLLGGTWTPVPYTFP